MKKPIIIFLSLAMIAATIAGLLSGSEAELPSLAQFAETFDFFPV